MVLHCKKVQDTTIFLILDFYSIQRTNSKSNLDDSENPEISKEEIS